MRINFDGKNSIAVRDFYLANVTHWIGEYHFDGLRLDATQSIHDNGSHGVHILAEIANSGSSIRRKPKNDRRRPKTSRRIHAWSVRSNKTALASMPFGTTISITVPWLPLPAGGRLISVITWVGRRNSSRRQSMAICIRDSFTPGKINRAEAFR